MERKGGFDARAIVIGLADQTRLAIVQALTEKSQFGEELSHRLGISPSTVSFHLRKLEAAGIVSKRRDQYYTIYTVKGDVLALTLGELIGRMGADEPARKSDSRSYRDKVLATFFSEGKLVRLPVQKKKRSIVLEEFAALFEPHRSYGEREVDDAIVATYGDYCTIRRELVDENLLTRKGQVYRLVERSIAPDRLAGRTEERRKHQKEEKRVTSTDQKAVLKKLYKENPPSAGIYRIANKATGKIFIGKGMNAQGKLNGQKAQLKWGSHRNKELQHDWKEYGEEHFVFEVIDLLEQSTDPARDMEGELSALEELWLNKLQPYGERGYNEVPRRR